MSGIEVDPRWLIDYANHVSSCADELEANMRHLTAGHLSVAAFGDVGKEIRGVEAYRRASAQLVAQLHDATVALRSAGDELKLVAGHHDDAEQESVDQLRKAMQD